MIEGLDFYVVKALWTSRTYFVIKEVEERDRNTGDLYTDYKEIRAEIKYGEVLCGDILTDVEKMAVEYMHWKRHKFEWI